MDSHDSHGFSWTSPRTSRTYNFPNSFELGQDVQPVPGPSTIGPPFNAQGSSGTDSANGDTADAPMEGAALMQPPLRAVSETVPHTSTNRRSKYKHLDWDAHKDIIRQLYLDDDKTLAETMDTMKNTHSFEASHKLYKAKFKEWHWVKNLPFDTATFMMGKAKARKRVEDKETVFSFGGRNWETSRIESTLARANKKVRTDQSIGDVPTPQGVSYKTPKQAWDTPHYETIEETAAEEDISDEDAVDLSEDHGSESDGANGLILTWKGYSRKDIQNMWHVARSQQDAGRHQDAETTFRQVLDGMNHVLGQTNEDTVQVAYQLADLYATTGQKEAAVDVVDALMQAHARIWGYEDIRTQKNTLKTVEILNSWGRHEDALGLLSLSKELLQTSNSRGNSDAGLRRRDKGKGVQNRRDNTLIPNTAGTSHSGLAALTPPEIDHQLGDLRARVAAKDLASQNILAAIIAQCEGQQGFRLQELKAHGELVILYHKLDLFDMSQSACNYALQSLHNAWNTFNWDEGEVESFDFMEVVMQLAANVLKSGHRREAKKVFRQVADKATDTFGADDERTVWVLITVGIVYQTHMTWADAEEWFEEAFAAACRNLTWGPRDGIVLSLQCALDNRHFSYISDKGRPYTTVFGVLGLKITPGRLHLE
ncbi:hypothetical protein PG997_005721 [Apiospora hydei]|uniref:Clr5 domain-containing protein n=1 Tax=Apiospora hydei TaxID=1337664 RepID=A0ABR1WLR1_9PEZI